MGNLESFSIPPEELARRQKEATAKFDKLPEGLRKHLVPPGVSKVPRSVEITPKMREEAATLVEIERRREEDIKYFPKQKSPDHDDSQGKLPL